MDLPLGHQNARIVQRAPPRFHVLINTINERSIEIEENSRRYSLCLSHGESTGELDALPIARERQFGSRRRAVLAGEAAC